MQLVTLRLGFACLVLSVTCLLHARVAASCSRCSRCSFMLAMLALQPHARVAAHRLCSWPVRPAWSRVLAILSVLGLLRTASSSVRSPGFLARRMHLVRSPGLRRCRCLEQQRALLRLCTDALPGLIWHSTSDAAGSDHCRVGRIRLCAKETPVKRFALRD